MPKASTSYVDADPLKGAPKVTETLSRTDQIAPSKAAVKRTVTFANVRKASLT